MPRAVISTTVSVASSTDSKIASSVFIASGRRVSFTVISVTSAERSLGADEEPREIVAGRVQRRAAETHRARRVGSTISSAST